MKALEIKKEMIEKALERVKTRDPLEHVLSGYERHIKKYGLEKVFKNVGDLRLIMDDEITEIVQDFDKDLEVKII